MIRNRRSQPLSLLVSSTAVSQQRSFSTTLSVPQSKPPLSTDAGWSSQIAEKYRLNLSPCLIDWFDGEHWRLTGCGEFCAPVHPVELLCDAPESLWPALMASDLLPLIGNLAGDFLCARIGSGARPAEECPAESDGNRNTGNQITEIVHWFHGGGDWIPWGDNLAQAIAFGALVNRLPGPKHRHAEPAEQTELPDDDRTQPNPLVQWAVGQLPAPVRVLFGVDGQAVPWGSLEETADLLLQHKVSEIAVKFELIETAVFPSDGHSDWGRAESLACDVISRRNDLAWAWNIAAQSAMSRGELALAAERSANAMFCSNFSDQSVRLRQDWDLAEAAKFAVAQLLSLDLGSDNQQFDQQQGRLFDIYTDRDIGRRNQAVTDFWISMSKQHESSGCYFDAHRCMMRAGWDVGAAPMGAYERILGEVARLAELDEQYATAALARTHLSCFRDRYGQL